MTLVLIHLLLLLHLILKYIITLERPVMSAVAR